MKLLQRGAKALLAQAKRASFLFEFANKQSCNAFDGCVQNTKHSLQESSACKSGDRFSFPSKHRKSSP
jgi:hypothetical protein